MIGWFLGRDALAMLLSLTEYDQGLVVRALDHLVHRPGSKVQINLTDPETYSVHTLDVIYTSMDPENRTLLVTALKGSSPASEFR